MIVDGNFLFTYKIMNNQLIEKVIKSNNLPCPEFVYSNPLLDNNVAKALSKSFVKILDESTQNTNLINNFRLSVLTNIRKICQIEPKNHLKVDENLSGLLTECYLEHIKEESRNCTNSINKTLDVFLMRKLKEIDLRSSFETSVNPDIVQALLNLNEHSPPHLEILSKDAINWKVSVNNSAILKAMWSSDNNINNDISIKIKSDIEIILLKNCHSILENKYSIIDNIFTENILLNDLINKCSVASYCFQICCEILNSLFIMTNFDDQLQIFITTFSRKVKQICLDTNFSQLYPVHVNHIVILLDFDLSLLTDDLKSKYVDVVCKYLSELHKNSNNDIIMLLSHFPQWFDIYFAHPILVNQFMK